MKEPDRLGLRDTAIYNPHLLSKEELIGLFSARRNLLEQLHMDLSRCPPQQTPQHHLLVAQRGMGKTTLLRRLQFAVEDEPDLAAVWLPLAFPEEQYNVARLSDLWLNCIDALGDALERLGFEAEAESLDSERDALLDLDEERRARDTLALLVDTAMRFEKRLVLLIDNVDLILERISEQGWALREVLSEQPAVLLIGASARALETSYKYDQPFYDFFQIHELRGLSLDETTDLLRHYAELWQGKEVLRVVHQESARIRTLHTLTGGNPRTIALLYNILARGLDGDVRTDLEGLLDHCTPLYKARLEALASQQQRVVHALAVHWYPATAADVSAELRLEVKAVSSQLTRLVKAGVVEAVPYDPATKTGFQLAERFFNIWYLMRATRRARRRLTWLVQFLKMFYNQAQLRTHALLHMANETRLPPHGRLRFAEYSFALAQAIHERQISQALETSGLYTLIEDKALRDQLGELVDLEGEEARLRPRAEHKRRLESLRERTFSAKSRLGKKTVRELWNALAHSIVSLDMKEDLATSLVNMSPEKLGERIHDLEQEAGFAAELVGSKQVAEALREAFANGWMMATHDMEGARIAGIRLGEPRLELFAIARRLEQEEDPRNLLEELGAYPSNTDSPVILALWAKHAAGPDDENSRLQSVLEPLQPHTISSPLVVLYLAEAWLRVDRLEKVKECIDRAQQLGVKGVPRTWLRGVAHEWNDVIEGLTDRDFHQEAAATIDKVINISDAVEWRSPEAVKVWAFLGVFLDMRNLRSDAEEAYRRVLEISPEDALAWRTLAGNLLEQKRFKEAEDSFHRAIELAPKDALAWNNLGATLGRQDRDDKAEEAYRRSVELSPDYTLAWRNLAANLINQGRFKEAETPCRKLIELIPEDARAWTTFGEALGRQGRHREAEEAYREAVELSPEDAFVWRYLAGLLLERERFEEAEGSYRKLIELTPGDAVAWEGLGDVLRLQNRHRKAEAAYRKAVELSPEDSAALMSLGWTLGIQGSYRDAEKAFRKALDIEPANAVAANNIAWTLIHQRRNLDEAEGLARQATHSAPDNSSYPCALYFNNLATILAANGKWTEAFERAAYFLPRASEEYCEWHWPEIILFFRETVSAGKAWDATELLDRLGLADRWKPLHEALKTLAVGRRSYLKRLAPEVRQPTKQILEELETELE